MSLAPVSRVGKKIRIRNSAAYGSKTFDYSRDYKKLDLRVHPELYRVGKGEQGVLLVEPYKSEILPSWRFKDPATARKSAAAISKMFRGYLKYGDFVGMDMARKFLQMGYTRARRYANHKSGRKYGGQHEILPRIPDALKAQSAQIFYRAWKRAEKVPAYASAKANHKKIYG